jgi:hypothetical protein
MADPPQAFSAPADTSFQEPFRKKGEVVVVINCNRTTAIVIRNTGDKITLVPMKGGRLSARTLSFDEFRKNWREAGYSLAQALTTFLAHVMKWGASHEVSRGLSRLAARDRFVVSPLF